MLKRALCAAFLFLSPVAASAADDMMGVGIHTADFYVYDLEGRLLFVDDRQILKLIGTFEGPDGYDTVYYGSRLRPPKPVTEMTVEEVQAWQDRSVDAGSRSSAVGVYQFVRKTLRGTAAKAGITRDTKFDRFTQDRLARFELRRCGFYKHTVPDEEIANCLAGVWAALPLVSGPNRGKSRYQGYAGNKSLTSVKSLMDTVQGRFRDIAYAGELRNYRPAPVEHLDRREIAQTGTVENAPDGIVFSVRTPTQQEILEDRMKARRESYARRAQNLRPFGGYVATADKAPPVLRTSDARISAKKIRQP